MKSTNPKITIIVPFLVLLLAACGGGGGNNPGTGEQVEQMPDGGSQQMPGDDSMDQQEPDDDPGTAIGDDNGPATGGGSGAATGGGSGTGGGSPVRTRQPSLSAKGVRAVITYFNGARIDISESSGMSWTEDPSARLDPPAGWSAETKLDGDSTSKTTARFHVVTDYGKVNDDDYLAYGFWSKNLPDTQAADGFVSFFYGNMPYAGNVGTLPVAPQPQPVTYRGGAAGVYKILGDLDEDVDEVPYGHFKANIRLVASFGQNGKVLGYITDITPLRPLNSKNPGLSNVHAMSAEFSGSTFVGRGPRCGGSCWGGQFFGPSGGGQVPTGAAGWFERLTSYESGDDRAVSLYGSFGAVKE